MTEQKRTYYRLPTDQYNQPTGDVVSFTMTEQEFEAYRKANPWEYLFEDYKAALYRAQD